jgi:hypothetical protein
MNRRTFLASSSVALLAATAVAGPPKRIAAILTEYWLGSHADVVIGKYLEGYRQGSLNEVLKIRRPLSPS